MIPQNISGESLSRKEYENLSDPHSLPVSFPLFQKISETLERGVFAPESTPLPPSEIDHLHFLKITVFTKAKTEEESNRYNAVRSHAYKGNPTSDHARKIVEYHEAFLCKTRETIQKLTKEPCTLENVSLFLQLRKKVERESGYIPEPGQTIALGEQNEIDETYLKRFSESISDFFLSPKETEIFFLFSKTFRKHKNSRNIARSLSFLEKRLPPGTKTPDILTQEDRFRLFSEKRMEDFQKGWRILSDPDQRMEINSRIQEEHDELRRLHLLRIEEPYQNFIEAGKMTMSGVALVASYQQEKRKLSGLFSCMTKEAFLHRLTALSQFPGDFREAFIIPGIQGLHKTCYCVEKKNSISKILQCDSLGSETFPDWLREPLSQLFPSAELFTVALQRSKMLYGCAVFALQDGLAFLEDPDFFSQLSWVEDSDSEDSSICSVYTLPPACLIGIPSLKLISTLQQDPSIDFEKPWKKNASAKEKNLREVIDDHTIDNKNLYITKKHYKYMNLILSFLETLSTATLQHMIDTSFLTEK